jgi:type II secretory pathway component PulF
MSIAVSPQQKESGVRQLVRRVLKRRLSIGEIIELCRSLRFCLASGLSLHDAMGLLAINGTPRLRRVASEMTKDLESGSSFRDSLEKHSGRFPPMFLSLSEVGEESGKIAEAMGELERYFEMQLQMRRAFVADISWSVVQFLAAVAVVSGLIYFMDVIPPVQAPRGPVRVDPLGFGLYGSHGALTFMGIVFGTVAGAIAVFLLARRLLRSRAFVERALWYVPLIGPCQRALAMTRFCVALQLMLHAGLSVLQAFRLAFAAADNKVFLRAAPRADAVLRRGNSILDSLRSAGIFPELFLGAIAVGEASGHVPEVLHHEAEHYHDLARRRMSILNRFLSGLIWLVVAVFVITIILRIYTTYIGRIGEFTKGF